MLGPLRTGRKIEGRRRRGRLKMRWLDGMLDDMILSKLQEIVKDRKALHAAVPGVTKSRTQLSDRKQQIILNVIYNWYY